MAVLINHRIKEVYIHGIFGHICCFGIGFCFTIESLDKVTQRAVLRFDIVSVFFALDQQVCWDNLAIRLPFIRTNDKWISVLDACPQTLQCFGTTRTDFAGDDAFLGTRVSKPNP